MSINTKIVKHFLNLTDFDEQTLLGILKQAHELKAQKFNPPQLFSGSVPCDDV